MNTVWSVQGLYVSGFPKELGNLRYPWSFLEHIAIEQWELSVL